MIDLSVAFSRYRFLGDEFLTWLWHMIESDPGFFSTVDSDCVAVEIGNRMVLENRKGKSIERITIKGDDAGLEEGRLALKKGALISEMALIFKSAEDQWRFILKGDGLGISGLKPPGPVIPQNPEDTENFLLDKVQRTLKIADFVLDLFKLFIKLRVSTNWTAKTVPAAKKWLRAEGL